MKRFILLSVFWAGCFGLLFCFYFVPNFFVIVGSGPKSWKKSTPLSVEERLVLSFAFATGLSVLAAMIYGCGVLIRKIYGYVSRRQV